MTPCVLNPHCPQSNRLLVNLVDAMGEVAMEAGMVVVRAEAATEEEMEEELEEVVLGVVMEEEVEEAGVVGAGMVLGKKVVGMVAVRVVKEEEF